MNKSNENFNLEVINAKLLIVDDEPANVRLLKKMLEMKGYSNIITTLDPTQTLPLFLKHKSDLILLDINMPGMDGYEVMQQLCDELNQVLPPILVLTAQHTQSFRQRALDNGALDYVTKPFNAEELLSRVHNLLTVEMANKYMRLQNEILEQKVNERTQELHDTRLQVVRRLGLAAEYRDNETGLHIIRMSKMAVIIAKASGMDEKQCDLLLNAAPMHDIGKIGISDEILLKPGKLEPDEWAVMQTHAQIGADILSGDDSNLMKMAHEIAISHHEKWNGKGYPNNLKGEDIPLVGRITALADVFDALTSVRPYKKAWTIEDAVKLIQDESGQYFDPRLVECMMENLEEIIQVKEKYAEPDDV